MNTDRHGFNLSEGALTHAIIGAKAVADAKVIERITDFERGQMLNYLRITKLAVGLIVNFHKPKLEGERLVL